MLNVFCFYGKVRSDPVLLHSKKTGNTFTKFTISIDGDIPYSVREKIKEREPNHSDSFGEVFLDCLAFKDEAGKKPASYILKNIHKYDIIAGSARLAASKKPVKEETDEYRSNWVYGDYIYLRLIDVYLIRKANKREVDKGSSEFDNTYYTPWDRRTSEIISKNQIVTDDDLIFNI